MRGEPWCRLWARPLCMVGVWGVWGDPPASACLEMPGVPHCWLARDLLPLCTGCEVRASGGDAARMLLAGLSALA